MTNDPRQQEPPPSTPSRSTRPTTELRRSSPRARAAWVGSGLAVCVMGMAGCAGWFGGDRPDQAVGGAPGRVAGGADDAARLVTSADEAIAAGDKSKALAELARAIEINPQLTTAHLSMGDIYRGERNWVQAERAYRRAAESEPRNFDAQYLHGLMLHLLDRVSEAIGAYLRALDLQPNDFQANLNVSAAYFQLGEFAQAVPFAERAVRLSPRDGPARFNLGAAYARLGRDADAVVEYQQAAELMPLTPKLLLNLSESLGRLARYKEMRNTLEQLVRSAPSPAAHERLGFALFRLAEADDTLYSAAHAQFGKALELDPNYFPALNGVGICELNFYVWSDKNDLQAKDRGLAALRRSLQINRDQPRIAELLSRYR